MDIEATTQTLLVPVQFNNLDIETIHNSNPIGTSSILLLGHWG